MINLNSFAVPFLLILRRSTDTSYFWATCFPDLAPWHTSDIRHTDTLQIYISHSWFIRIVLSKCASQVLEFALQKRFWRQMISYVDWMFKLIETVDSWIITDQYWCLKRDLRANYEPLCTLGYHELCVAPLLYFSWVLRKHWSTSMKWYLPRR